MEFIIFEKFLFVGMPVIRCTDNIVTISRMNKCFVKRKNKSCCYNYLALTETEPDVDADVD